MRIVAADIGGTHARLALAELTPGERPRFGEIRKYRTREARGLAEIWAKFERDSGGALPPAAAIAVAAPIEGGTLTFMNNDWRIPRFGIAGELGLERLTLLNDFGAVAYAVSVMSPVELIPICGSGELPADGITTVLGIARPRISASARSTRRRKRFPIISPRVTAAHRSSGSAPGPA
jgi:glucokinase